MRRLVLFLLLTVTFGPGLLAQTVLQNDIACFVDKGKDNAAYKKKLWGGYEISLGPTGKSEYSEETCTGAIYSATGKVVYRTTGYNVIFDQNATGKDFDGDGHPEIVFKTDTGGGMHCCWEYNVISLAPRPHKLFDIPEPGRVQFEKDQAGKMLIWVLTPGPYGFTSNANNPFAQKVFRVVEGKLTDATPEFCAQIMADSKQNYGLAKEWLTPERTLEFQSLPQLPRQDDDAASAVLTIATQQVFCGQFEKALATLEIWPASDKARMKSGFAGAMKTDYPEFTAKLQPR
ncbi:MAG TPA: hypothetical protein VKH81_11710 [Candidatus Angelobacter sp.]|nr:hypothetical protein [Candidatus Angelobacter sp.]